MKKIQEKLTVLQVMLATCVGVNGIAALLAAFQQNWFSFILDGGVLLTLGTAYFYNQASLKEVANQIEGSKEDD